jgi:outer membrane protein OmpA-like peptidoglycan-associated protein
MTMKSSKSIVPLFIWLVAGMVPVADAADVAGSADYPGIGRFDGSEIEIYSTENYDSTSLATGPVLRESDVAGTSMTVEGAVTRIIYRVPRGSSALEVFRNFENRITEAGYTSIVSGGSDQFDYRTFVYSHPVEKLVSISMSNEIWYLSAKKSSADSITYVSLLVSPHSGGDGQRARLIAVTTKTMENRMIDAEKMLSSIAESGKVALYGIYFDTDSDTIKDSSAPTLQEIARLLGDNPGLNLIVVGHTDNQGSYDYNMDLSRRRAESVANSLSANYGVNSSRLRSAGVGFLAPAASNADAAGQQLNRRVELVRSN